MNKYVRRRLIPVEDSHPAFTVGKVYLVTGEETVTDDNGLAISISPNFVRGTAGRVWDVLSVLDVEKYEAELKRGLHVPTYTLKPGMPCMYVRRVGEVLQRRFIENNIEIGNVFAVHKKKGHGYYIVAPNGVLVGIEITAKSQGSHSWKFIDKQEYQEIMNIPAQRRPSPDAIDKDGWINSIVAGVTEAHAKGTVLSRGTPGVGIWSEDIVEWTGKHVQALTHGRQYNYRMGHILDDNGEILCPDGSGWKSVLNITDQNMRITEGKAFRDLREDAIMFSRMMGNDTHDRNHSYWSDNLSAILDRREAASRQLRDDKATLPENLQFEPIQLIERKVMLTQFETIEYINNTPAADMSADDLIAEILSQNEQITALQDAGLGDNLYSVRTIQQHRAAVDRLGGYLAKLAPKENTGTIPPAEPS